MYWRIGVAALFLSCTAEVPPIITPSAARLVMPSLISLPYVELGQPSSITLTIENTGDLPFESLSWSLTGDSALVLSAAPTRLEGHSSDTITVLFTGAPEEHIAEAQLSVEAPDTKAAQVFAVAGDSGIGEADWEPLLGPNQELLGEGATISLPTAPYPDAGSSFTDASVRFFIPEGYRDRGAHDVILHFHGHSTTLGATLAGHKYQEHVYESGVNAILLVPQGPVNTASGDFGKLMNPANTEAFFQEALIALYREGKIAAPRLGDVVLTSHSGGYQGVAANINNDGRFFVSQVNLFDSLYGFSSTYQSFAQDGGLLRSNYTAGGGTLDNNQALVSALVANGVDVSEEVTTGALRDSSALIYFADTSHGAATRLKNAFGEQLRWGMTHSRRGPRMELRSAVTEDGTATLRWVSPRDEDLMSFLIETSPDGETWTVAAEVPASQDVASIPLSDAAHLRVTPLVVGVSEPRSSDEIFLDPQGDLLVVDGFDRRIDGSFAGLTDNFSALLGEAARASAYASHAALTEDGFALGGFSGVIWLSGDESTSDLVMEDDEQELLREYLASGGKLLLTGSEIAFAMNQSDFLLNTVGASLQSDDSASYSVIGVGALSSLGSFLYSQEGAPYQEDFPDALAPQGGAEVLLQYENGMNAAIGRAHQVLLVGFPLELIEPTQRAAVVQSLLSYLQ